MPDHVHLLVSMARTLSIADLVRLIKSNSSGWFHDELCMPEFQWQTGYGAFAVSFSGINAVKACFAGQVEHHRTQTFQDEFREILRRHELESDERYVWD